MHAEGAYLWNDKSEKLKNHTLINLNIVQNNWSKQVQGTYDNIGKRVKNIFYA